MICKSSWNSLSILEDFDRRSKSKISVYEWTICPIHSYFYIHAHTQTYRVSDLLFTFFKSLYLDGYLTQVKNSNSSGCFMKVHFIWEEENFLKNFKKTALVPKIDQRWRHPSRYLTWSKLLTFCAFKPLKKLSYNHDYFF